MNTATIRLSSAFFLALAAAACSQSVDGSGEDGGDTLDVEPSSEAEGLRATTTIDGETITIWAKALVQPGTTDDGEPFDDEILQATISGSEQGDYAELKLRVLTDEMTGTLGGLPFGDVLAGTEAAGTRDWAALSSSHVGAVLSEVSARAEATRAAATHPQLERYLALAAEPGPLLQTLPTLIDGEQPICGDGQCSVDETDESCPEDCGCAAEGACGGVAPFGCYCSDDCAASGDCCVDACMSCGAGCPACDDGVTPCGSTCADVSNVCDGVAQCPAGEDEARCAGATCAAGQLACDDGSCVDFDRFCEGVSDCAGGEDEMCTCAYCDPG
jgi:hypothetical protein